jgi:hypothetical protein
MMSCVHSDSNVTDIPAEITAEGSQGIQVSEKSQSVRQRDGHLEYGSSALDESGLRDEAVAYNVPAEGRGL